jgi:hypothetical protein
VKKYIKNRGKNKDTLIYVPTKFPMHDPHYEKEVAFTSQFSDNIDKAALPHPPSDKYDQL